MSNSENSDVSPGTHTLICAECRMCVMTVSGRRHRAQRSEKEGSGTAFGASCAHLGAAGALRSRCRLAADGAPSRRPLPRGGYSHLYKDKSDTGDTYKDKLSLYP